MAQLDRLSRPLPKLVRRQKFSGQVPSSEAQLITLQLNLLSEKGDTRLSETAANGKSLPFWAVKLESAEKRKKQVGFALMKKLLKKLLEAAGLDVRRRNSAFPVECSPQERDLLIECGKFSMTGPLRMWAFLQALKHIIYLNIPGDVVECGVWRGGNLGLASRVIGETPGDRLVYGFDTFSGMTAPTRFDQDTKGRLVGNLLNRARKSESLNNIHAFASLPQVRKNLETMRAVGNVRLIEGAVEKTLAKPENLPDKISILRLDTDWYESTKIELEVLYPRLSAGGVLIIDDYGHYTGARKAVDDYFGGAHRWFHYVDYTCRLMIKDS